MIEHSAIEEATTTGPSASRDNWRSFDWTVLVLGVAIVCTAAWIGFLFSLIIWAVKFVLG